MKNSGRSLRIHVYDEPSAKILCTREIASYLEDRLCLPVNCRSEFLSYFSAKTRLDDLARKLAETRIKKIDSRFSKANLLYGEIEYERRAVQNLQRSLRGVLYDGLGLQAVYSSWIEEDEDTLDHVHIALTSRLFATYDESDKRYHARVIVCGFPSLISTSGIVQAPAKPREFYLTSRIATDPSAQAFLWEQLKKERRTDFIDYDDERLTEVMKGYCMQALFYHIDGWPFCETKTCRLYNAHWQEELIKAQLTTPEFCETHERKLAEIRAANRNSG